MSYSRSPTAISRSTLQSSLTQETSSEPLRKMSGNSGREVREGVQDPKMKRTPRRVNKKKE